VADFWNRDWLTSSPLFAPLRKAGALLPAVGWPDVNLLNAMADESGKRIVNANGARIRFITQDKKPDRFEEKFEPSAFLRGEVLVRRFNWHDLFNAMVWMTFPTSKAALNARHYQALAQRVGPDRSPEEDALTMFDEDGMLVLSSDPELLELLRGFRWKALFWKNREQVQQRVRFFVFGHALYEKSLKPYVGMTGRALLLEVPQRIIELERDEIVKQADRIAALRIFEPDSLCDGKSLMPVPLLGIPGWWEANSAEQFYDNTEYFRSGRKVVKE
jgi:hypothetical protein